MVTIKHVIFADLSVCLALEKTNITRERDSCRDSETEMIRIRTGVWYWVMLPFEGETETRVKKLTRVQSCSSWCDSVEIQPSLAMWLSVSKCDHWCVQLSVSADWRRLIPIRRMIVTRPDIIVPDVNHLTTSNQELHPVIDPDPNCPLSSLAQQFTDPGCQIYQSNTIVYFCTEAVKYIFYKVA